MVAKTDNFEKLREAVALHKAGRKNAAKAVWWGLEKDFREKVLTLSILTNESPPPQDYCKRIVSEWGRFTLAWNEVDSQTLLLQDVQDVILELVNG